MVQMALAMFVVVLLLGAATGLEAAGLGHPLWLVGVLGGIGALGGAAVLELLKAAQRG